MSIFPSSAFMTYPNSVNKIALSRLADIENVSDFAGLPNYFKTFVHIW